MPVLTIQLEWIRLYVCFILALTTVVDGHYVTIGRCHSNRIYHYQFVSLCLMIIYFTHFVASATDVQKCTQNEALIFGTSDKILY